MSHTLYNKLPAFFNEPRGERGRSSPRRRALTAAAAAMLVAAASAGPALAIVDGGTGEAKATFGSVLRLGSAGNYWCSAVLLSDTIALTAAHCVADSNNQTRPMQIHMQRQGSRETPCITWKTSNDQPVSCAPRLIEVRIYPKWKGSGDTESDIAVLHIKNNKFQFKNGPIPEDHFARLYDDVWDKSRNQLFAGFGPANPSGAGWGEYHESRTRITGFEDYHYRVKAGPNSRICKGDSGGPAFLRDSWRSHPIVAGLNANTDVHVGQDTCVEPGKWQRWVKVSPKVDWISETVRDFTGRACRPPHENKLDWNFQLCFD